MRLSTLDSQIRFSNGKIRL